jgi:hypothetical protein
VHGRDARIVHGVHVRACTEAAKTKFGQRWVGESLVHGRDARAAHRLRVRAFREAVMGRVERWHGRDAPRHPLTCDCDAVISVAIELRILSNALNPHTKKALLAAGFCPQ